MGKKPEKLVRVNPRFTESLARELKDECAKRGLKMEFFVSQAVREKLDSLRATA